VAIVSFDTSLLATPARTGSGLGTGSSRAPAAFTAKKVELPSRVDGLLASRLTEIRARKSLIDEKASTIKAAGDDRDLKTAFTLYRALDGLRTLSEAATSKATTAAQRAQINAQFQKGLSEIQTYLTTAETDKLTLQFGAKASRVEAILPPRAAAVYTGLPIVSGASATAISGVSPADRFQITLSQGIHTDVVEVDLADITGAITLRAVTDLANSRIASIVERDRDGNPVTDATGNPVKRYASAFQLVRTNDAKSAPATFGFTVTPGVNERVSLQATTPDTAAFVVNHVNSETGPVLNQWRRVDALEGTPVATAVKSIAAKNVDATALARTVYEATKSKTTRPPAEVFADTKVAASAIDSQGFLYVVGTTRGAVQDQSDTKADDVFLTKYDSNGVEIFSRKLGSHGTAQGAALAIDANDNIIVAGTFDGQLAGDKFAGADTLVLKFDSAGREKFAVQLDSVAADGARAVTVNAAGDIFIAGTVTGTLTGASTAGGQDGFVARLNGSTGALSARTQFGTSGKDAPAALAIATDGALLVAGTENGVAVLRRFNSADITLASTEIALGNLSGGDVTSLAVDRTTGAIALGGSTRSSLNGDALAGAADAFVVRLDSALTIAGIAQFGTNAVDQVTSVQYANGKLYAGGKTSGDLVRTRSGASDIFLARLNASTGAVENISQFGTPLQQSSQAMIAVTENGPGVLAKLGLRQGDVRPALATTLVDRTILREGDQFSISVGGKVKIITIEKEDDAKALAKKISTILQRFGEVKLVETTAGTKITVRATTETRLDLLSGPKDRDALAKLNLPPGQLRSSAVLFDTGKDPVDIARTPGGSFGLDLADSLALADEKTSGVVMAKMDTALETIKRAYRSLYYDPAKEALARSRSQSGQVPEYLKTQLGNYQDALRRLTGSSTGVTA
jgi:trimeric autotransporter adhesin